MDEFVRHDAHFLDGESLNPSSWEAFDNPAFFRLLSLLDLFGHDFHHDIIIDAFIGFQARLDAFTGRCGLAGLAAECFASLDALPLEVFGHSGGKFIALAAGGSHEEDSIN